MIVNLALVVACIVLAFLAFAPAAMPHAWRFLADQFTTKEPQLLHTITIAKDDLYFRAEQLVLEAEGFAFGTSGEYKRTHVYAKLIKEFPGRAKREISQAIEAVL